MKYGLTDSEFQFLQDNLIRPLKEKKASVFLFGSRATGKFRKFSDIDLLFISDPAIKIAPDLIYSLLTKIEESDFPYKVDLVDYHELATSYKASVDQEKIAI